MAISRRTALLAAAACAAVHSTAAHATLAVASPHAACVACFAPRPRLAARRACVARMVTDQKQTVEPKLSSDSGRERGGDPGNREGLVAASALASSAVVAEGVQLAGTAVLFYLAQRWTQTDSPVEAVTELITYIRSLGAGGYAVFSSLLIFLQVVPVAAAFILTVSAGAIFGAVKGTALVITCSTISATISFQLSRTFGRELVLEAAQKSPQYQAIDTAFARASFPTSLTLISLLRLSPILPFSWANYVFGLSGVPWLAFSLGTFLGCLPPVAAYVSAGQLGADIVVNGSEANTWLVVVGIIATIAAVTIAGRVASQAIRDMDVDLDLDQLEL